MQGRCARRKPALSFPITRKSLRGMSHSHAQSIHKSPDPKRQTSARKLHSTLTVGVHKVFSSEHISNIWYAASAVKPLNSAPLVANLFPLYVSTLPNANRKPGENAGLLPNLKFSANNRSRPLVVVVLPGHVVLQNLVRHDFRFFIARALDAAYNSRLERLPFFQQLVRALRIHVLDARNPL